MNASHVAGGGLGAVVSAIVVGVCTHYFHLSAPDASVIGSAAVAAGVGVGHVVGSLGIVGAIKRLVFGAPKTA